MPYCPKCGREVNNEMSFCPQCGVALGAATRPITVMIRETGPRESDMLGLMSAGVVLIILALTYIQYPVAPVIIDYFQNMADEGAFIKIPLALFDPVTFFLYAVGVWGIVLSGLRMIFQRSLRKALGDLCGGFFSFFCAFLLTSYFADVFTGRTALAYFVVAIGLLVVVNAIIFLAFPEKA